MISIIIPTFNRSNSLLIAVQSILNHQIENIEIIVIDDGSTDNTKIAIEALNNPLIKYIQNTKNIGTVQSKIDGIAVARGEYIGFLDDDDIWTSNTKKLDDIATNADIIMYNFKMNYCVNNSQYLVSLNKYATNFTQHITENIGGIFMQACLFKKKFIQLHKTYLDNLAMPSEDWDFFLSLSQYKPIIQHKQSILFQWNFHAASQSGHYHNETSALKYILNKHALLFNKKKKILGHHYRILSNRYYYDHDYQSGNTFIKKSLKIYPYSIKTIMVRMMLFFPVFFQTILIKKYTQKII